jgi:hypothetical protein
MKELTMSAVAVSRIAFRQSDPQEELEDELHHIRDLVFVRDLLRERGATSNELRQYDAVIDQAHARLARSAKRAANPYAAAA